MPLLLLSESQPLALGCDLVSDYLFYHMKLAGIKFQDLRQPVLWIMD